MAVLDAPGWAAGIEWTARYFERRARPYPTPAALARCLNPALGTTPALTLIDRELAALPAATDHDALAIFIPVQEGKSQAVSRAFPTWLLENNPALRIPIISYEQDMALRWGRDIRQDVQQNPCRNPGDCAGQDCGGLHIEIRRDSSAAGRWETPQGGGIYCVGIGGPLTGRPADLLILDDPVKDRAAAESVKIRNATWDWWESVALTRLAPGGKVALVMTRWHEDDLAGRIFSRPSPLRWKTVKLPAIAEHDDQLGRVPGEELISVRGRAPGFFQRLKATMSPYVFSGIYQQSPTAPEGNFFRRAAFRYWRPLEPWADGRERLTCEGKTVTLADCWRFGTADVAASLKTSADWTVICAWAVSLDGDLILLDRARARTQMHDHFELAQPLLDRWGISPLYVESQWFASTLIDDARAAGYPVAELRADTDKITRAIPAAGRVHAGKAWFPAEAAWLDDWCDELAAFPQGTHDDQVDCLAYAARALSHEFIPVTDQPRDRPTAHDRAVSQAYQSAVGNGHTGEIDLMNVPW